MPENKKNSLTASSISRTLGSLVKRSHTLTPYHQDNVPPQLLRLILQQMASPGVLLLDHEMNPVFVNSALTELLGQQIVTGNWHDPLQREDAEHLLSGLAIAVLEKTRFKTECRLQAGTESTPFRWLGCEAQPLYKEDCGFEGCLCTFTVRYKC